LPCFDGVVMTLTISVVNTLNDVYAPDPRKALVWKDSFFILCCQTGMPWRDLGRKRPLQEAG
ncbi:hypothetical protein, partial [Roseovarius indicus]|uniref:hypothetical protein n=1 Tax=Roseovarius indicus TaxID=540747 RepID=UPI001F2B2D72